MTLTKKKTSGKLCFDSSDATQIVQELGAQRGDSPRTPFVVSFSADVVRKAWIIQTTDHCELVQ